MTPTNAERRRARNLRPALAFLRLPSTEPELNILHRVFDNLGLITVGVECQGDAPLALAYRRRGMAGDVPGQPDMGARRIWCGAYAVEGRAERGVDGSKAGLPSPRADVAFFCISRTFRSQQAGFEPATPAPATSATNNVY
jgi:hypothetical protein